MLSQKPRPSGKLEFHNLKDLEGGQVYGVALRALDEAGNMSAWATVLLFVDGPTGTADTSPPTAPSVLTGQRVGTDVHLVWTASPDADVVAYRVFRHQGNGLRLLQEITGTEFWDTSAPKSTARYTVSAVDAAGNESRTGASVEVGPESTALRFDPEGRGGTLSWSSSEAASVPTVQVFDVRGRLIADLVAMEDAMGWRASW